MSEIQIPSSAEILHRKTYLTLRRAVGILMISMPLVLIFGESYFLPNNGAEKELRVMTSMSAYYHTPMGDILVGAFAAVGFFMIAYSGHDAIDNWVSNLAGAAALGVAAFPTELTCPSLPMIVASSACDIRAPVWQISEWFHLVATGSLLILAAVISIFLFTKSREEQDYRPDKIRRNKLYKLSGYLMLISGAILLFGIGVIDEITYFGPKNSFTSFGATFALEAVVFMLFGVSWLTSSNWTIHHRIRHFRPKEAAEPLPIDGATKDRS